MTCVLDASVLVAHLAADPADDAAISSDVLASDEKKLVSDVAVCDAVAVLEGAYRLPRHLVATALRALLSHPSVVTVDTPVLLRAIEIYEIDGVRFPSAYAVALAESTGVDRVASLDTGIDRLQTIERVCAR